MQRSLLEKIGFFCATHKKTVIFIWLLILILLLGLVKFIGTKTSDDLSIPGTESTKATNILDNKLPDQANGTVALVFTNSKGQKKAIEESLKKVKDLEIVRQAPSPWDKDSAAKISKDKEVVYSPLLLKPSPSTITDGDSNRILDRTGSAQKENIEVSLGGYAGEEISEASDIEAELIGVGAAIIILLLALGTVFAMMLPILTAIFAVGVGLALIGVLGHLIAIPVEAQALATMIGLGVGIDYSLFILTRFREARKEKSVANACAEATRAAGSSVLFAGSTVVLALLSLLLANIPIVAALGYSAAIVVVVAVCAALTLIPALLALMGDKLEKTLIKRKEHKKDVWKSWASFVSRHPLPMMTISIVLLLALSYPLLNLSLGQSDDGQLSKETTAYKAYSSLAESFGPGINGPLLIATKLDSPAHANEKKLDHLSKEENKLEKDQKTLQKDIDQINSQLAALPQEELQEEEETKQYEEEGLAPPPLQPLPSSSELLQQKQSLEKKLNKVNQNIAQIQKAKKEVRNPASDPLLQNIRKEIKKENGVKSVSEPLLSKDNLAAVYSVVPEYSPASQKTKNLVYNLRDQTLPKADKEKAESYVGGTTAGYIDLGDRISDKLPSIILIVILLSFVLLFLAFRSIVVPLTAAIMNLFSVGAAYGVLTAVFENDIGGSIIGLDSSMEIVSFVPLIMFAILFGLSMDYEVFLLSRIKEHFLQNKDNKKAIIEGLSQTGKVITSAALIMFCVFFAFVLEDNPVVKQFGLGMAVAIAVDATIVRCLLVPAVMVMLGRSNWWLPGFLDKHLPHIGLDESSDTSSGKEATPNKESNSKES